MAKWGLLEGQRRRWMWTFCTPKWCHWADDFWINSIYGDRVSWKDTTLVLGVGWKFRKGLPLSVLGWWWKESGENFLLKLTGDEAESKKEPRSQDIHILESQSCLAPPFLPQHHFCPHPANSTRSVSSESHSSLPSLGLSPCRPQPHQLEKAPGLLPSECHQRQCKIKSQYLLRAYEDLELWPLVCLFSSLLFIYLF